MKRFLSLLLALSLVFCFAACGKTEKNKPEETTASFDLEYYVKAGKIPECEFGLGEQARAIKEKEHVTENEGFRYICLAYDNSSYYYLKEENDEEIDCIVSFNGAYGFQMGTTVYEVTSELAKSNLNAQPENLSEDDTFFMPIKEEYSGIKYTFDNNTVCFVFRDGALCACSMERNR